MNRDDLRVHGCGHGDYDAPGPHPYLEFISDDGTETWKQCDDTRPVSDAELAEMGLVVVPDCEACEGDGELYKPLGTMSHSESSPHYLTPSVGFLSAERLPPGRYRVGDDDEWIAFDLLGEDDALTNAVYLPEVEEWRFGEVPLSIMWDCPSCGGSGKEQGAFVSRSQLESWLADSDKQYDLEASFERLLAALDKGETDGN